jgi:lipooligosaccharide transport system ATP-binding protein
VQDIATAAGLPSRRNGPAVSVLRADRISAEVADKLGDGVHRPASLEDVFVLLTGEVIE